MLPITLFISLAKRYENIASKSINRYVELCENNINEVFLVVGQDVDITKLDLSRPFRYIRDSEAAKILGANTPEFKCIIEHKWMAQQFFKIHCDVLSGSDNCIITDCDGLLLKKINYFTGGKVNLFYSNDNLNNSIYKNIFRRGKNLIGIYDFLTENVLFQKKYLVELRSFLGDFRQFRLARHNIYDMTLEEYQTMAGVNWPKNPKLTEFKNFHENSVNTVIFSELPESVQQELLALREEFTAISGTNLRMYFSEYEVYNYFLLEQYPNEINLRKIICQVGFDKVDNAEYWFNEEPENDREAAFMRMYNNPV